MCLFSEEKNEIKIHLFYHIFIIFIGEADKEDEAEEEEAQEEEEEEEEVPVAAPEDNKEVEK